MICLQGNLGAALSSAKGLDEALNMISNACLRVKGIGCSGMMDQRS